jgi:cytochrome d ubiquinol oxidase subunit I
MNTPTGFTMVAGELLDVDPLAAMFNKAAFSEALHMVLAAFAAVGFAVAGIHAAMLLRRPNARFIGERSGWRCRSGASRRVCS